MIDENEMLKKELFHWRKAYNIKRIKTSIRKMEHHKISKLLNDSPVLYQRL